MSAEIIHFDTKPPTIKCSFCKKDYSVDAHKVIQPDGVKAAICYSCVEKATALLKESTDVKETT